MARPRKARPVSVTIYQGADGLWHGYLTVGTRPDGRPDRRHRSGKTRDACENKIRKLEDELAADDVPKAGRPPTVEQWLRHWCENIARPTVSWSTYQNSYRYSVYNYLIPGLGAHRLDQLEPEHLEALYPRLLGTGLAPATVALVHRTMHAALEEAVRRDRVKRNVAKVARSVEPDPEEVDPLTIDECRRLLCAITRRRNGARWSVGMLGLRQGEVLALQWNDLDLDARILTVRGKAQRRIWRHGCDDPVRCARWRHGCSNRAACRPEAWRCPRRKVRCRAKPCPQAWEHGCPDPTACKAKQGRACRRRRAAHCPDHRGPCPPPCPDNCAGHARTCPQRTGGGIVLVEEERAPRATRRRLRTKSSAGTRRVGIPVEVVAELREHRKRQREERMRAGSMWEDNGLIFCTVVGRPIDAGADRREWKALLADAGVRDARGHDVRHTAATLLLLKGVDRGVVMATLGWTSEKMLRRYQHVLDVMRIEAADRLGEALFEAPRATDHATGQGDQRKKTGPRPASRQVRGRLA